MLERVGMREGAGAPELGGARRGGRVSRKPELLQATIRCVARNGIGATTAQIADEAGVPKSTIHYYFKDKSALIAAAFEEVVRGFTESLDRGISSADPPAKQLETLILRLLPLERRGMERAVFWYDFILAALREPDLMPLQRAFADRAKAAIEARIRLLERESGSASDLGPEDLAILIDAFVDGLTMALVRGEQRDREQHRRVVSFLVSRIFAPAPPTESR